MATRNSKQNSLRIFKIDTKWKLSEMIKRHKDTLVILIYILQSDEESSKTTIMTIKELAKSFPNYYYVFIDIKKFDDLDNDYYDIKVIPFYVVYFNDMPITQYLGPNYDLIKKNLTVLTKILITDKLLPSSPNEKNMMLEESKMTVEKKNQESIDYPDNCSNSDNIEKATYLKKLFMLTKQGIKLTNSYNMKSDLDEIVWELNLHTNPNGLCVDSQYKKPTCFMTNNIKNKISDNKKNPNIDLSKLLTNPSLSTLFKNMSQNNNNNKKRGKDIESEESTESNDQATDESDEEESDEEESETEEEIEIETEEETDEGSESTSIDQDSNNSYVSSE